jgi:hypothetical protein
MPREKNIIIDCRDMEPPEPMIAVLEKVESLQSDQKIIMIHRKEPNLLYAKLKERGCEFELKTFENESIELTIWKTAT